MTTEKFPVSSQEEKKKKTHQNSKKNPTPKKNKKQLGIQNAMQNVFVDETFILCSHFPLE